MKHNVEIGSFILRVVLGITFFLHGLSKFQGGIENTAGWFASIGLPGFLAYLVAVIELAGGIALIVGLGTRIISALLAMIMLGAILKVKLGAGFLGNGQGSGYELDIVLMAIAVFLALNGSFLLSIDAKLPRSTDTQRKRAERTV
ncbi:DoxX family protein [Mesobacillus foraminis]|uniref:DoxX family protein n=1 Tax=Mesobacillus foraminis TaxID=279826 RepID=UPI000EF43EC8|nr:DoxX family protein [Mesobacillus foraminis]